MDIQPYRYILSGTCTKDDAVSLLDDLDLSHNEYHMLKSVVCAQKYSHMFNLVDFEKHIDKLSNIYTYEDAYAYFANIKNDTSDIPQIKTLLRIINMKKHRFNPNQQTIFVPAIIPPSMNCPFCNGCVYKTKDTSYVVCGFDTAGFDIGCRNESCFVCKLKFCNKWTNPNKPPETHIMHNDECCAKHAKEHNHIYPDEYCMCSYSREL